MAGGMSDAMLHPFAPRNRFGGFAPPAPIPGLAGLIGAGMPPPATPAPFNFDPYGLRPQQPPMAGGGAMPPQPGIVPMENNYIAQPAPYGPPAGTRMYPNRRGGIGINPVWTGNAWAM
jgi:hypothetical protein